MKKTTTKTTEKKPLKLDKHKLRELKADELQAAQGGCCDMHPTQ